MIQRIQTVYLIAGALALAALLLVDGIWTGPAAETYSWFAPAVLISAGVAAVTGIVAVFLYKDRPRQKQVVVAAQLLVLVHAIILYGGLFAAGTLSVRTPEGVSIERVAGLILPILAYLLYALARRGVQKDIELVRSMDRLR
ncbi:MAG: DUF4293 family protein [Bacteroidetes bacterium]|jgi:hypothetical protein|nr:DUF4293 family protein [Bacteroidota bacterium]